MADDVDFYNFVMADVEDDGIVNRGANNFDVMASFLLMFLIIQSGFERLINGSFKPILDTDTSCSTCVLFFNLTYHMNNLIYKCVHNINIF